LLILKRPSLSDKKLSIAIPASVVSDTPHLREKTAKVGLIGRAAAIFRVDEIIIYSDQPRANQAADARLVGTLLSYIETPQYLRKRLFKIMPELQFAGVLPPLRTPHHPTNNRKANLKTGEHREGVVLAKTAEGLQVDIGVEQPALVAQEDMPVGKRITVKIVEIDKQIHAELADRKETSAYGGYAVTLERQLFGKLVKSRGFDLAIATSKYGAPFADMADLIVERWRTSKTVMIAFGPPTMGLHEIAKQEELKLEDITDFVVNTIPEQGTETVRTEEAVIASLAILNVRFGV
jgi:predicted SPOUT superfamily RNA methylase MTH1